MSTKAIKLYDILVEKGVDKDVARDALAEFVTEDEAAHFATKADLSETKNSLIMWMVGTQITSTGLVVAIMALMFNVFV